MTTKTYFAPLGHWNSGCHTVSVKTLKQVGDRGELTVKPLDLRLDLRSHSPTGFAWGYGGSGPAQLALALLSDATGDDELAGWLYQTFKWQVIAKLDQNTGWELTQDDILTWVRKNAEPANLPEHIREAAQH